MTPSHINGAGASSSGPANGRVTAALGSWAAPIELELWHTDVMIRFVTTLLALVAALPMYGFDADEHKYLSNLGLRIAMADGPHSCVDAQSFARIEALVDGVAVRRERSFGDVTSLADYVKDVSPIFDSSKHSQADPVSYTDVDWVMLDDLRRDTLRFLQAASLNENHFRRLSIVTHLVNHEAAMNEARAGRWIRALLFEAYAIHFLQDFLSPGHVATPRSGTTDFVSIGWHDRLGARGLDFHPQYDSRLASLSDVIANRGASLDFGPLNDDKYKLQLDADAFASLRTTIKKGGSLRFKGDSRLYNHPEQAAFIALLSAYSIREVLYACETSSTAFRNFCFRAGSGDEPCNPASPGDAVARIFGGEYDLRHSPQNLFLAPGEVTVVTVSNAWNPASRVEGQAGSRSVRIEALLFGLSPFTSANVPTERAGSLTTAYRSVTPAVLYGYSRGVGPGTGFSALHTRFVLAVPRTNLQFSAVAGIRRTDLRGSNHRSDVLTGGALEAGFGFLYLHFGAETDLDESPLGGVRKRLLITTGVTGIVPGRTVTSWIRRKIVR